MYQAGPYDLFVQTGDGEAGPTLLKLGSTESGFKLRVKRLGNAISADEHGDTVVDGIHTGKSVMLEVVGLEHFDDNGNRPAWEAVFPEGDGEGEIGSLWSDNAVTIVARPRRNGQQQYTFHKCICQEEVELLFSGRAPKKVPCVFLVLPDYEQDSDDEIFYKREDYEPAV